ncbi:hypothetical protein FGG08_006588 [Glutinoglossum americanum]|uniref:Uncharacterized protein n=1 Tax=Glutinoglossum americanum TaxID=1670608 RepID=A0A9P8I102_9PEZI|nr:hypothetical protein FGG08_006588 [Glutinoglossum americanum]
MGNLAWDMKRLDDPGIKAITFEPYFDIDDTLLAAIACRPNLASSLVSLTLGSAPSGVRSSIIDHGIIILKVLKLSGVSSLTDTAFLECCRASPSLEYLKFAGLLTNAPLQELILKPGQALRLSRLVLIDKRCPPEAVAKELSAARPCLIIRTGTTLGNSNTEHMCAMGGSVDVRTWCGGRVVGTRADFGVYSDEGRFMNDWCSDGWEENKESDDDYLGPRGLFDY